MFCQINSYSFRFDSTYHAHGYNQSNDVEHPVPHGGLLERMHQRLIIAEEAAFVRLAEQFEE